jgi:hypothetical protein
VQGNGLARGDAREEGSRARPRLRIELSGGGSLRCPAAAKGRVILTFPALALAALLLLAAPAAARPWDVQTIDTPGAAFSRGVDVLPSGQTALLLQRRAGATNRLELRLGRTTRLLDSGAHVYFEAAVDHDSHGRMVIAWLRFDRTGGATALFTWTTRGGKHQIAGDDNPATLALAVAPSGRAALAYWSPGGVHVARAAPGAAFSKPENVDATSRLAVRPGIAVASGGRIVVAWSDGRGGIFARAAGGAAPFGTKQGIQLRAPAPGATLLPESPKVVMTASGRAVVCISSDELRDHQVVDSRVEAFDWPIRVPHPSGAATLSRGAAAGTADIVSQGTAAAIAWTQRPKGSPRALWVARWTSKGLERPNIYDTRQLGLTALLAPAVNGALDAFYRAAAGHWFTVRLSSAGHFTGTTAVTPPGASIDAIDVAGGGSHPAAAWTRPAGGVQMARPHR